MYFWTKSQMLHVHLSEFCLPVITSRFKNLMLTNQYIYVSSSIDYPADLIELSWWIISWYHSVEVLYDEPFCFMFFCTTKTHNTKYQWNYPLFEDGFYFSICSKNIRFYYSANDKWFLSFRSKRNKKVLLCDRKRHTAHGITSAALSSSSPDGGGGGSTPPSSPDKGSPTQVLTG